MCQTWNPNPTSITSWKTWLPKMEPVGIQPSLGWKQWMPGLYLPPPIILLKRIKNKCVSLTSLIDFWKSQVLKLLILTPSNDVHLKFNFWNSANVVVFIGVSWNCFCIFVLFAYRPIRSSMFLVTHYKLSIQIFLLV